MMKSIGLGCLAYAVLALIAFGDLLKPIAFATSWSDRLGAPQWQGFVLGSFIIGASSFLIPARFSLLRGPVFVAVVLLGSLLSVSAYADHLRSDALNGFGADRKIQHSFLESIRHAPDDHQFFLHAATMKHCVPYAWSYRSMGFYRLPPDVAVNVLPVKWLAECSTHSDRAVSEHY